MCKAIEARSGRSDLQMLPRPLPSLSRHVSRLHAPLLIYPSIRLGRAKTTTRDDSAHGRPVLALKQRLAGASMYSEITLSEVYI